MATNNNVVTPSVAATQQGVEDIIDAHLPTATPETEIKAHVDRDYIANRIGKELIAWCSWNPNQTPPGTGYTEVTYRSGNRRGLKVFLKSDGYIYVERSDATGDDYIGTSAWVPSGEYEIHVGHTMPHASIPNPPIVLTADSWTSGSSPNTSKPGFITFVWMNRNGSIATVSPTSNDNGIVWIEVWKPVTAS